MLKNLNSDDRENLDGDPVELVETAPSASLSETHEDVAARLVVHLLGAVEDVDHDPDGSSKILRRLCFACSSRSLGCASHDQVQALGQGDVTPGNRESLIGMIIWVKKVANLGKADDDLDAKRENL